MSSYKKSARMQQKRGTEEDWKQAGDKSGFIPLAGEIIIYLPDEKNKKVRIKIGDGVRIVDGTNDSIEYLPFVEMEAFIKGGYVKTLGEDGAFTLDDGTTGQLTADTLKYNDGDSATIKTEIDKKLNSDAIAANLKYDKNTTIIAEINNKVNKAIYQAGMNTKVNISTYNADMQTKVNTTTHNADMQTKMNKPIYSEIRGINADNSSITEIPGIDKEVLFQRIKIDILPNETILQKMKENKIKYLYVECQRNPFVQPTRPYICILKYNSDGQLWTLSETPIPCFVYTDFTNGLEVTPNE